MGYPNTLIFVDLASDDPSATGQFYADVMGWTNEGRPEGHYHRLDPGDSFRNSNGEKTEIGNLHIGIFNAGNARPNPEPSVPAKTLVKSGAKSRLWFLVSDDDDVYSILERATSRGATELWRDHYWSEFNGYNAAFQDPWGNEIILWVKAGPDPQIPDGFTQE